MVHAFKIDKVLAKDGDSTTNTKDVDEEAWPGSGGWLRERERERGEDEEEDEGEGENQIRNLTKLEEKNKEKRSSPCNWKRQQQRHDLHKTHANRLSSIRRL